MKLDDIKIRVDELIQKGNQLLASRTRDRDGHERIASNVFAPNAEKINLNFN